MTGGEIMENWLSVAELSKCLDISETRIKEYLNGFDECFSWEQIEREKRYNPDAIKILRRIVMLDKTDLETTEIKKVIAEEFACENNHNEQEIIINPLVPDISENSDKLIKNSFKGTFFSTIVFVGGGIVFFWVLLFLFFTSRLLGG